ncbi:unnamed protein product [Cyprideis torosa]|uniref:Uncharacterized protein n=1 Tax=Cyprideis torosa TaxID=163714 RepID=A0A7R8ZIR7_9CRUS|nr:unnamed protein product [Cyprideis torosa]CAG0880579.1 unnamed protein product [Cyprideis torosa]
MEIETRVISHTKKTIVKTIEPAEIVSMSSRTTNRKLYGKDLSAYDDVDVETLLDQLTPEEIDILSREVDPDDNLLPAEQRCSYKCAKSPTGPLDRKKLIEHINREAIETPDVPDLVPYEAGKVRGKRWIPPPQPMTKQEEEIRIDLGDEYEQALSGANDDELVDLAAILGLHSMMNQDQYHASLLDKDTPVGLGWDGITKATRYKPLPPLPPNPTDVEESIQQVKQDDSALKELNWNNIQNVSDEKFERLFEALKGNTRLESLSLCNVGLKDKPAHKLCEALERNSTLRVLNVESNFLTPPMIRDLVKSILVQKTLEEFRAANQSPSVLGNKIEMEICQLIEKNPNLLRLGMHFEYNDVQNRVVNHMQKNCDKWWRQERLIENVAVSRTFVLQGGMATLAAGQTPTPHPSPIPPTPEPADKSREEELVSTASTRDESKNFGGDFSEEDLLDGEEESMAGVSQSMGGREEVESPMVSQPMGKEEAESPIGGKEEVERKEVSEERKKAVAPAEPGGRQEVESPAISQPIGRDEVASPHESLEGLILPGSEEMSSGGSYGGRSEVESPFEAGAEPEKVGGASKETKWGEDDLSDAE